jgi:glycosyltransferase involved in cell wall biosynthesis
MRIAVNTRFLLPSKMEGFGWYTFEIVKRLVEKHPEHEFLFFFDRPYDPTFIFGSNVQAIVLRPPARHPLLFLFWFEFAVFKALKKHKADVFFSPDGYLSLRSTIPQIGVIHDINFEHHPKDLPFWARHYLRYFFPKFAKKATHLITVSDYSKNDISKVYGIELQKISSIYNGASPVFNPIDSVKKEETKKKWAGGNSFFLFVGALHARKNVGRLIEAFSLYARSTDATYDLVIVGEALWKNKSFKGSIPAAVKSRIHFTGHLALEELAEVMGAASVFTFVPYFEGFGIPLVEAMQCGTPILAGNLTALPEVAGEAALYCNPMDSQDIGEKMGELANKEELRNSLSKKGLERSKAFSWDAASEQVWEIIDGHLPG